ncbi:hypothetical protein IV203_037174 [Nitzschia inconspicua]|uniref:Uncharacterized protein n=1 Tax=Nitzschia inconspicua TaxID=303405 RepID=A0A9K3PXZ8_9STRA|nr:hypothetical protein IV203_037174 [Nitzschia inconspicua]
MQGCSPASRFSDTATEARGNVASVLSKRQHYCIHCGRRLSFSWTAVLDTNCCKILYDEDDEDEDQNFYKLLMGAGRKSVSFHGTLTRSMLLHRLAVLFVFVLTISLVWECSSFVSKPSILLFLKRPSYYQLSNVHRSRTLDSKSTLVMRDRSSSYWFQVGDTVRVVSSEVTKDGINLFRRVGTVMETWEKCDVDPTCCCAEQVDPNMAVRVEFDGTLSEDHEPTTTTTTSPSSSFNHYFSESELEKVVADKTTGQTTSSLPFDGRSCVDLL